MFAGHFGLALAAKTAAPGASLGVFALGLFAAFIALVQAASYLGPPPPSVQAIAFAGLAQWLLPPWAHWLDKRRTARDG